MTLAHNRWRFWWVGLFVAWAVDFLFWGKLPGISFPLWVLLALAGVVYLAAVERIRVALPGIFLVLTALALAFFTYLRGEPMTRFLNGFLSLLVLALFAATLSNGDWIWFTVKDYLVATFYLVVAALSRPLEIFEARPPQNEVAGPVSAWRQFYRQALPVLRGLILAIPVMFILGALLASADPVFNDWATDFLRFLDLRRVPEYIFRLFLVILPLAYLLSGAYLHAVHPKRQLVRPDPGKAWLKPFLGWTECTIVLAGVNLLFAIFVAIQFRYLFGGEANITEAGYTYSEYARRGFGELVAVAVLSLLLYIVLGTITKMESRRRRIAFSSLAVILIGLVVVMLASAMKRLGLYENAYGFTRLRTYTHFFILWMALLLLVMVLLELTNRRRHFALSVILFALGFSITLAAVNVDGYIVRRNVQRTLAGEELDAAYLRTLSSDAFPEMIRLYGALGTTAQVRDQLGLVLVCRVSDYLPVQDGKKQPWQSDHLGEDIARNALLRQFSGWQGDFTLRSEAFGWSAYSNVTQQELYCMNLFGWD